MSTQLIFSKNGFALRYQFFIIVYLFSLTVLKTIRNFLILQFYLAKYQLDSFSYHKKRWSNDTYIGTKLIYQ